MSAIITVSGVGVFLSIPGSTPAAGLTGGLELIRDAIAAFPGTPAPEAFAPALCGLAWRSYGSTLRMLPAMKPQARTSHLLTVGLSASATIRITSIIYDEVDDTHGQLDEGSFICADVLRDIPLLVRALT